jgi:acetyltransferase-like isoleucine patch superfamily enzyme
VKLAMLQVQYRFRGIEVVNAALARPGRTEAILARFGARVGGGSTIHWPLVIHNADPDYRNLKIGRNVHVGRGVLLDLTDELVIEDDAVISMGCTLLTHADIGDRPLAAVYPRQTATTVIGAGAYLGANVTVLCGMKIGDQAVIGAGAVVTEPVPDRVIAAGVPAHIVKAIEPPAS